MAFVKSNGKRLTAFCLAMLTVLTALLPIIPASAAEITMDLSDVEVSYDYTLVDEEGNSFSAGYGIHAADNEFGHEVKAIKRSMHDYTAKRHGLGPRSEWVYGQDYVYCFCIEPGVLLPDEDHYVGSEDPNHGDKYQRLSANQKDLLTLALTYGYPNRNDLQTSADANACYAATQLVVWQIALGFRSSPTELNDKSYPISGYSGTMTEQYTSNPYLKRYYDAILKDMAENDIRPSFTTYTPGTAKSFSMEFANGKYSVTLTDTNKVLENFYVSVSGGVSTSINGNTLTLSSSQPLNDTVTIKLNRKYPRTNLTTGFLIWSVPGKEYANQDMVSGVPANSDPVPAYVKVQTAAGSVKIVKTAEDGKVDGVKFRVQGNGIDKTVTTANGGQIQIDNLTPGTYTVTEQTENMYRPQESRTVTVVSGRTATVTFNNTLKRGDLTVTKIAEDGLEEGAKFHLYGVSESGIPVDEYAVVGSDKKAYFRNILIGTGYTIEEVDTEYWYVVPDEQEADIEWNKVTNKTFENDLKRGDLIVTKVAEDGLEEGAKFHLCGVSESGIPVDEYAVVGSDKKAYFRNILIGTGYTIEEVDTDYKYVVPDDQTADIEWNKVTEKNFDNDLKRGDLTVTKTAEDGLEQGMRFHLYGISESGIPVDEYATVGEDKKAYFKDILIGTNYTLEEVGTPLRYVIPDMQTAVIEWNKVTKKSFDNPLKKWNLTVTKYDSEKYMPPVPVYSLGGDTQGDATLAGAVYGIYKGDVLIDTYTTDANGRFTTKYYVCDDDWTLREISPSEGYLLDKTVYHIGAEAKNFTVEYNPLSEKTPEDVIKGKIALIKHTDDGSTKIETPEVGAKFEVFLKSAGSYAKAKDTERDYLVCDEYGFAETKELPYGTYTVRQVSGWDGRELLPAFDVYVREDGEVYRYLINNSNFESYIKIVKTDAETGKPIPYAGAGFQIYDPSGKLVTMTYTYPEVTTIDTFYTNSEGYLITPEKLPYGKGYSIVEVQAPYAYVLNSDPVYFDITEDNATAENAVTVIVVTRPNLPQKGTITVGKTGEVFSSVVKSGDLYLPVYEIKGLAGAVYEIRAAEDIYTPDGTLRYKKGELVDTVTTTASGFATSKALYLGKFSVQEIKAPYGMVLNGILHTVELTYAGQEIEITETATDFVNDRQKVQIDLSKIMEQDDTFRIGQNGEILSVQFGLFAAEKLVAADGTFIPKDGLIEIVSCDENGNAVFVTDLPVGAKLYVKEIATDAHYILSDAKYSVVFDYAGQEVASVSITVNDGEKIDNDLIYGRIKGLKIDRETGETIAGAVFGLFRGDETEFTEKTAILFALSGEDGVFTFDNVPFGNWIVAELMPADGFLPNDEIHHVHVTTDGEIIEITVVNDRIPEIGTTATTEDGKETHPYDKVIIEDRVEYKHLIPGKEYTLKGILMDKATGKPFLVDGRLVVSIVKFIPDAPTGTVIVTFTFDGSGITENTELVVFEALYKDGVELTVHADIDDEDQTVTVLVPEIGTKAEADGEKVIHPSETIVLEDTVSYENLIPGKEYTIKGILMNKATGMPFLVNGEEVYSEVTFIPASASGAVIVTFIFDGSGITENTDIVVFEALYKNSVELAVHADIEDEDQTVTVLVPEIGTKAEVEGEKVIHPSETIVLEDTVSYENLIPGKEYTVKGILMNKATGMPFLVNGEEVYSEITFIPDATSGEVVVTFTFDGNGITENTEIVVFETLYMDSIELAVHADIEDEDQTVTVLVPEIGTTATVEGEKEINATEVFTLEDVVGYENLIPGKAYTLKGVLMDKTTGEPLLLDGKEVRSEVTFIPEASSGEVVVTFTFDSKCIKTETDIVVFESLYQDDAELTVHADIEDEGQTVTVHIPEIGTQASVDGQKEVPAEGEITIEDVVSYKNLTPGKAYTVSGILVDKATGNPFTVDGEEIRAEVTFVPETPDGEIAVTFTFNAEGITVATEIVVFESIYREDVEIASHADIEDEDQTVKIVPPTPDVPQTDDTSSLGFWIGLGAIALGGLVAAIIMFIKGRKDDED